MKTISEKISDALSKTDPHQALIDLIFDWRKSMEIKDHMLVAELTGFYINTADSTRKKAIFTIIQNISPHVNKIISDSDCKFQQLFFQALRSVHPVRDLRHVVDKLETEAQIDKGGLIFEIMILRDKLRNSSELQEDAFIDVLTDLYK